MRFSESDILQQGNRVRLSDRAIRGREYLGRKLIDLVYGLSLTL